MKVRVEKKVKVKKDFGEEEDNDKELREKKEKLSLLVLRPPLLEEIDVRVMMAGGPTLKIKKVKLWGGGGQ